MGIGDWVQSPKLILYIFNYLKKLFIKIKKYLISKYYLIIK